MARKCDLSNITVMSGNNVSHSNRKTKRKFFPNLRELSFLSEALGTKIKIKVAASTLRTINKYGNIDNFLINYRYNKLSDLGKKLRNKIKKSLSETGQLENVKLKSRKFSAVSSQS